MLITFAVIGALIVFAVLAIDRNNVNRLTKFRNEALTSYDEAYLIIEERFEYARTLGQILREEGFSDQLTPLMEHWDEQSLIEETSRVYREVDSTLAILQHDLYLEPSYLRMAPYFEHIYAAERALIEPVERYNDQVAFFNAQRSSFPAILAARRLDLDSLNPFDIATALKSRP
jgi:hypothetical protein